MGGGFVGPGGTGLHTRKYSLEAVPRMKNRLSFNDVWSSADGIEWHRHVEHAPWSPRHYCDVAVWDDKLWMVGGSYGVAQSPEEVYTEGNRNDCWYSADGTTWTELPNSPWLERHCTSLFVHRDSLWLAAGNAMLWPEDQIQKLRDAKEWDDFCPMGEWAPGDVWRLTKRAIGAPGPARL